jgi:hypothetical protein
MGATIETRGIVATFPLADLKEGLEFYLLYSGKYHNNVKISKDMLEQAFAMKHSGDTPRETVASPGGDRREQLTISSEM